MSGSAGADRIKSREHFKQFLLSYEKLLKDYPGFVSIKPSGSYNSNLSKQDFGDIDLITHIESNKDKATVKKELAAYLAKLPDSVIVPFGSERYKGKKFLNTGEIITVRYHDKELGYSVQIDNIIALDHTEAGFKSKFLDLPAEKQGLILGLTKVATIETPIETLFKKVGIKVPTELPKDEEYEFNLSSIEIQLRKVTYESGSYKQLKREVVWKSRDFAVLEKILYQYNLNTPFEDLIKQAKTKLKNPRSSNRMKGVFTSMISVKSGEVGTQKGRDKEIAIKKVMDIFGENRMLSFKSYIDESHQIKLNGKLVDITLPFRSKEDKLVIINTPNFDSAFKKDKEFYIGKGGVGSIKGRYKGFELFALGGKEELAPGVSIDHQPTRSIEASEVTVDKDGNVSFTNGRHRYAWMRDKGIKNIYVAMDTNSIENSKRYGLIK